MKQKYGIPLILAGTIVLQCLVLLFFGNIKEGLFVDEIYSYALANSFDADKICNATELWNNWIDKADYNELISVQEGEEFAYATVYQNNASDCHPPLYYWILHTISSFFPNVFSKWFGIGLNMAFFVGAVLLLFHIGDELFHSKKMALALVWFYGFSSMAVNTTVYIRMYMMLTFFAVWFLLLQLRMWREGVTKKRLIGLFFCVFLGVFTHYYFAIMAFWGMLFWLCRCIKKKEYRTGLFSGGAALAAILLLFVTYPFVFSHVLGSETNNVGNEIVNNFFNVSLWFDMTKLMLGVIFSSLGAYPVLIVLILVGFLIWLLVYCKKPKIHPSDSPKELKWMLVWNGAVLICTFLSITFIGGQYVYMRYFLFLMPQLFLILIMMLKLIFESLKLNDTKLLVFLCLLSLWNGYFLCSNQDCVYLYNERAEIADFIEENASHCYGIMVVRDHESNPVAESFQVLLSLKGVYMGTSEEITENKVMNEIFETERSCVVMINTDVNWSNGYDANEVLEELFQTSPYTTCFYIDEVGDVEIYYVIK